jgi:hypothetical protein
MSEACLFSDEVGETTAQRLHSGQLRDILTNTVVCSEGYVQAFFTTPATDLAGDPGSLAERLRKGIFSPHTPFIKTL